QNWGVDALIGTDSMPNEGADGFKGTFRFHVASGLLSMENAVAAEGSAHEAKFFKCGKALHGMYSEQNDTTQ
ncbi:MAG TPA: hypothetical protein VET30_09040, partial [Pseudoxanthomonas sp.]|nr:hypothetical protein [Pseudoxanthomonas sp.]